MTILDAAREIVRFAVVAAQEGNVEAAAKALRNLAEATLEGGESILDLLISQDMHAELTQ